MLHEILNRPVPGRLTGHPCIVPARLYSSFLSSCDCSCFPRVLNLYTFSTLFSTVIFPVRPYFDRISEEEDRINWRSLCWIIKVPLRVEVFRSQGTLLKQS